MRLKTLLKIDISNKKVLLRVGFDVPIENGKIVDDHRVIEGLPTIKYLLERGCEITVINHIGRPEGKVDSSLSNKPVEERVKELIDSEEATEIYASQNQNNFFPAKKFSFTSPVDPAVAGNQAQRAAGYSSRHIYRSSNKLKFLENIRFDPREEKNDNSLAQKLAQGQDIFIQDAFSNCHRVHASMVAITQFLPSYAGLLVEKEVKELSKLIDNPAKPMVVIIGGAKVETKVPIIENLKKIADFILVGGATANEANVKGLFVNDDKIIIPIDGIKDENNVDRDIGAKTVAIFKEKLSPVKTIFWSGNLGMTEDERFKNGSQEIAEYITTLKAFKTVGGGDTVKFINDLKLASSFDFISTGGGASLAFLSGKELPGLLPFRM